MSFTNPTTPLKFEKAHNGYRSDTYQTDFDTGRSWVNPTPWLRLYKDGGVSLHSTGHRNPEIRHTAWQHGIEIELFGRLRGTLTTPDGEKVPRSSFRKWHNTVLMEGDRVYPLGRHYSYKSDHERSPQDRLPPAHLLESPLVVWQDRSMMPVCSSIHTIHVPSKDLHDKWMDEHGDTLKVARTLGALSGLPVVGGVSPSLLAKLATPGEVLNDHENNALYRTTKEALAKAIMHLTAQTRQYEYLILTPS